MAGGSKTGDSRLPVQKSSVLAKWVAKNSGSSSNLVPKASIIAREMPLVITRVPVCSLSALIAFSKSSGVEHLIIESNFPDCRKWMTFMSKCPILISGSMAKPFAVGSMN